MVAALVGAPATAQAHGPVAPVATSYLAKVSAVPGGLDAKVVDGYVRMWLSVPARETVLVLDYIGAPYLRFSATGVQVNENSSMYYLNQTPVAATPPSDLRRTTPPSWHSVSDAHAYEWHDGRLQALASVAVAPGTRYLGRWRIPLVVNGQAAALAGGLWHADAPTLVWFWPIVVLLACVAAALRVRRESLDGLVAKALGIAASVALAVAAAGQSLHGRPNVSVLQIIELAVVLAFATWAIRRVGLERPGYFTFFLVAFVALWEGAKLIPALTHPYVLIALPAVIARAACVLCLATGVALLLFVFRLADRAEPAGAAGEEDTPFEEAYG